MNTSDTVVTVSPQRLTGQRPLGGLLQDSDTKNSTCSRIKIMSSGKQPKRKIKKKLALTKSNGAGKLTMRAKDDTAFTKRIKRAHRDLAQRINQIDEGVSPEILSQEQLIQENGPTKLRTEKVLSEHNV